MYADSKETSDSPLLLSFSILQKTCYTNSFYSTPQKESIFYSKLLYVNNQEKMKIRHIHELIKVATSVKRASISPSNSGRDFKLEGLG